MDYVALGKRIREERLKLRLTQEKLSEEVNISDSYMGQIERGERSLTLENLVKVANRLGVTIDYLLSDSVQVRDEALMNEIIQLFDGREEKEKHMAVDMIKTLFRHLD